VAETRIGIVDIDTSHPPAFVKLFAEYEGIVVAAVCDGGAVWDREHVEQFADENGIEEVCDSPEEMVPLVDGALVQSANWDVHLERARPFIEAGKAVFIDKPVVGNVRDGDALIELVEKHDTPIICGSSARFADEVTDLKARLDEFGAVRTAFVTGPSDLFNYGIHIVEMFQSVFGTGVSEVSFVGENGPEVYKAVYPGGPMVLFQTGTPAGGFSLTLCGEKKKETITLDNSALYAALVRKLVELFRDRKADIPIRDFVEPVKVLIAAKASRRTGGVVALADLAPDEGFDGREFIREYAAKRRASA